MKVLILSQYWHPENGVPQRRWTWLSEILHQGGHSVSVITPPAHYQHEMSFAECWRLNLEQLAAGPETGPSSETIVRSGFIPSGSTLLSKILNQFVVATGSLLVIVKPPKSLKNYRPDLVIGTVPALPTAVITRLAALRYGAPYIIDLRDAWPDLLEESRHWERGLLPGSRLDRVFKQGVIMLLGRITKKSIYWSLRNANAIFVTSQYLQENLQKRPQLQSKGKYPEIETIRNLFPAKTPFTKSNTGRDSGDTLNVLYAGTLGRAQNLMNVIEAVKIAEDRGVKISLRFVGTGASRVSLERVSAHLDLKIKFEDRKSARALAEDYEWADTALVHLTDWEPLKRTVPSKLYELMSIGLHITGVVSGETAELITRLGAGHVVDPEAPSQLADLWISLFNDRNKLSVNSSAAEWVDYERKTVAPQRFMRVVTEVGRRK